MVEEIGEQAPDDPWGPTKDGLMTFLSFLVFGSVPMWVYVITYAAGYANTNGTFGIAAAATVVTLYALGALQGVITRQGIIKSGLAMTVNGSLAAASAYLVSWGILQAIGNGSTCG
jgi:vacuolar iron transporter family protein